MGFKLKPSSFKQTTSSETRQRTETTYGKNVVVARRGERTKKNFERWGTEYAYGLKYLDLLDDYKEKAYESNGVEERMNNIKDYISRLDPGLQWELHNYRQRTFYPKTYDKWKKANPGTQTVITEQRDTTTEAGTSGGKFENVWEGMSEDQKAEHGGDFDKCKIAAEKWNEENPGTEGTTNRGDWYEKSRVTRRTT